MKARALLAAAPVLALVACSLSLDGFTGGDAADAGPEGGTPESGAGDSAPPPPPSDAATDAGDAATDAALTEGCQGDPTCVRVMFATHDLFATTDFGSLAGADALCERVANAPGTIARIRNRPLRAWLSTSTSSVTSRLVHGTANYIRFDGDVLAKNFETLVNAGPAYNVDVDEFGHDIEPGATVWTGTMPDGTSDDMLCNDWTSSDANTHGLTGLAAPHDVDAGVETWTFNVDQPCNTVQHLYCVEK